MSLTFRRRFDDGATHQSNRFSGYHLHVNQVAMSVRCLKLFI